MPNSWFTFMKIGTFDILVSINPLFECQTFFMCQLQPFRTIGTINIFILMTSWAYYILTSIIMPICKHFYLHLSHFLILLFLLQIFDSFWTLIGVSSLSTSWFFYTCSIGDKPNYRTVYDTSVEFLQYCS